MARVAIPEKDQVGEELATLFQKMEDRGSRVLNVFKVMGHCPTIGRNFLRLGNSILFKGRLDPRLRELAILRVGDLAKANYEWTQHVAVARRVGVPDQQIEGLHAWRESPHFNPHERAILQYTDEVAEKIRVAEETFQAVKAFLTEEQIVELTTAIGYYGMVCRLLESLQVELEDDLLPK
ncbi:MAG: carboxymuconolactone decarboxylase family protein [Desulfobacteraceae bacterium]|nr:MAG: carboxymuconolactone decarboxylase family protein [Desulfobacteraceae bacterium]